MLISVQQDYCNYTIKMKIFTKKIEHKNKIKNRISNDKCWQTILTKTIIIDCRNCQKRFWKYKMKNAIIDL